MSLRLVLGRTCKLGNGIKSSAGLRPNHHHPVSIVHDACTPAIPIHATTLASHKAMHNSTIRFQQCHDLQSTVDTPRP
ncbi:hypothetical protein BDV93DRAFT_555728 [Ceratobasidium sp. AG-I]|nr:hypothetical protein BDV93DRAFT_555728 [Ceratobasidium sp. AG-I]